MRGWKVRALTEWQILLLGFAVFVTYGFPGYMSTDSVHQLIEARSGKFSDGHPPIMAAHWWVLDRILSGPLLMLLVQGGLFLGGVYAILRRFLDARPAAWTAIGVLLYPPVLTTMAVIWKDSLMAAYLLAGIGALLQPRLRTRLIGLGLFVIATALRYNALAAVAPLIFFVFEWRSGVSWLKRFGVLVATIAVTIGLAFVGSRLITSAQVKMTPVFSDIAGVIACAEEHTDEEWREVLRGTPLVVTSGIQERARKLHYLGGAFRVVEGEDRLFKLPSTPEEWDAINRAWKDLVLGHPLAYVTARWHDMSNLLGLDDVPLRAPVWNLFLERNDQWVRVTHTASHSMVQAWIGRAFNFLADDTPLFRPYVYAMLGIILLIAFCRDRLTIGLIISGLLYELSFFPVGANPDYRYSHWMITSVCLATVILFIQRSRKASST